MSLWIRSHLLQSSGRGGGDPSPGIERVSCTCVPISRRFPQMGQFFDELACGWAFIRVGPDVFSSEFGTMGVDPQYYIGRAK
jgi:hypothetical protein